MNKRKILEAARKHAQKGAKDRALKEYEKLLKLDPRDAKLRLEIGDAHRRWGQLEEAIGTYVRVAEQYMAEGFDARAVAVFKQIHNLDAERWSTYEPLAELYQRMGLASDAISTLQIAADGFRRAGNRRDALSLLRKMAAIDPSNTTSRLKVADLLRQEGMNAEAVAEYEGAADEFERQGEMEPAAAALARVLEIEPERVAALARMARGLLAVGEADRAEPFARRLLDAESDVPEHYEVLADVHRVQRREDALAGVYRRLAELYRRRGDEDLAREITQRFVPVDGFGGEAAGPDDDLLESGMKGDISGFLDDDDGDSELLLDEDLLDPEPPPATRAALALADETGRRSSAPPPPLDGDPEQMLAEACVYLRYGKRREAIASLEAIVAHEPRHRGALEKLGEARAEAGDTEGAVQVWLEAAAIAQEESDAPALEVLRDRIAALDQAAAATLGSVPAPEAEPDIELDLDSDEEFLDISEPVAPAGPDADIDLEGPEEPAVGFEERAGSTGFDEPAGSIAFDESAGSVAFDEPAQAPPDEIEIEIDMDLDGGEEPEAAAREPGDTGVKDPAGSSAAARQVSEELEEAEFYLQQGMLEEAETLYKRLLAIAPNHPQVMVRLGELAAVRGDDPAATGGRRLAEPDEPAGETDTGLGDWADDLVEPGALDARGDGAELPDLDEEAEPEGETVMRPRVERAAEWTAEITSELSAPDLDLESEDPGDTGTLEPVPDDSAGALPLTAAGGAEPGLRLAAEPGFDLDAELHAALDDGDSASGSSGLSGSASDGFSAVFQEFKRGVSQTLDAGDHEAHYDLAIAYREMGLFDDAMAEFRLAAGSPERRVVCLHMLGQCALELGRAEQAVEHLQQALDQAGLSPDQQLPLRFDLGCAFEARGELGQARAAWEAVAAVDPAFADVEERLERLGDEKPDESPEVQEGFESFEDVVAEAGAAEPAAAEAGVDFADLVAELNADEAPQAEPAAADPDPSPPAAEPEVRGPAPEPPRPRKRKKISFV